MISAATSPNVHSGPPRVPGPKTALGGFSKTAPQAGITWSNSTNALGLSYWWAENRTGDFYRARYYDATTGRFLSEDPSGLDGSSNFYSYVANSPVDLSDPFGLRATAVQHGNTITVSVDVGVYGVFANQQTVQQWNNDANNYWNNFGNNFHYGHCKVVFHINYHIGTEAQAKHARNRAYVEGDPNYRSRVYNHRIGIFANNEGGWAVSHETGHLMNLPDDYHDQVVNGQVVSVPNPGHAGHMMGQFEGTVVQHEVGDILKKLKCKCNPAAH